MSYDPDTAATISLAASRAEQILGAIHAHGGDLGPAYEALEEGITELEQAGHDVDEIVPADSELSLGFWRVSDRSGKGFWAIYSRLVRRRICSPDSALRGHVDHAMQASTGAIVGAVVTALALPLAAAAIAAGIAAILISIGIDAFCEMSEESAEDVS